MTNLSVPITEAAQELFHWLNSGPPKYQEPERYQVPLFYTLIYGELPSKYHDRPYYMDNVKSLDKQAEFWRDAANNGAVNIRNLAPLGNTHAYIAATAADAVLELDANGLPLDRLELYEGNWDVPAYNEAQLLAFSSYYENSPLEDPTYVAVILRRPETYYAEEETLADIALRYIEGFDTYYIWVHQFCRIYAMEQNHRHDRPLQPYGDIHNDPLFRHCADQTGVTDWESQ